MTTPTPPTDDLPLDRPGDLPLDCTGDLELELARFFDAESFSRTRPTRARYRRVQARLGQFLDEVDVTTLAGHEAAARLAAERDRGRHGAFGRALGFEELLGCLGDFVTEEWLPGTPGERRTHISLAERLARHLRRRQLIDPFVGECLYLDALDAIQGARGQLPGRPRSSLPGDHRLDSWLASEQWLAPEPARRPREIRGLRIVRDDDPPLG